jgi:hypothetical protein
LTKETAGSAPLPIAATKSVASFDVRCALRQLAHNRRRVRLEVADVAISHADQIGCV